MDNCAPPGSFSAVLRGQSVDKVDLLFMIDNSSSMGDKQALLAQAVPDLVTRRSIQQPIECALFVSQKPLQSQRAEVLESYNPIFEVPTTATLVDGSIYFMANTQVDRRSAHGTMPLPATLHDIVVLRLNL